MQSTRGREEDEIGECKMKVRDRKPKCCEQIKGGGRGCLRRGGGAKPMQVAQSPPKRAANSCHSLSNVRLPGGGPSSSSIAVS